MLEEPPPSPPPPLLLAFLAASLSATKSLALEVQALPPPTSLLISACISATVRPDEEPPLSEPVLPDLPSLSACVIPGPVYLSPFSLVFLPNVLLTNLVPSASLNTVIAPRCVPARPS